MNWNLKRFEKLTLQEMYEILRLRNEVFVVEQKCPYQDIDDKDQNSFHLFAAGGQGGISAYLRILDKGQTFDEISIGRVIVRPDKRGSGLAREMLQRAIDFVEEELHEHQIRIEAQAHLSAFYGSAGFRPCSEVFLEDGIPHIEMFYDSRKPADKIG